MSIARKRMGSRMLWFIFIIVAVLLSVVLFALGYRLVMQQQIVQNGEALTKNGGISVVEELQIGGIKQYILMEGEDKTKPVCLFLHGGPGSPFPFGVSSRSLYPEITGSCVAVYYDQRGAGKSYSKDIDIATMNIEQFITDANEVVDYVRTKFHQNRIYIIGNSFGTIIGTELAYRFPEKFHAYIALGQITNIIEGQKLAYQWLLNQAEEDQDQKAMQQLHKLGAAPYFGKREEQFGELLNQSTGYNYKDEHTDQASIFGLITGAFISPDYTITDIYKTLVSGAKFSIFESTELQEEIISTNLFATIPEIKVPVYFIQGKHDMAANFEMAKKYYEHVKTPKGKRFIVLENSAHYPNRQDFDRFLHHVAQIVDTTGNN